MKQIVEPEQCCGCAACAQACPAGCIEMRKNSEGFLEPVILKGCTDCGRCLRVCPALNAQRAKHKNASQTCYAFEYADADVVAKSASGGAFTAIAEAFAKDDYLIFGAVMAENFITHHTAGSGYKKYRDTAEIQIHAERNPGCVSPGAKGAARGQTGYCFSGTGCQIAGLTLFLGRSYDNLLTADLVCHGVANAGMFREYISFLENRYQKKVKTYWFRSKMKYWSKTDPLSVKIMFADGKEKEIPAFKDVYMRGFLSGLLYRKACNLCPYASLDRPADITIADFWGIEKADAAFDSGRGASLILANTAKGAHILESLKDAHQIRRHDVRLAIPNNRNLKEPTPVHPNREMFYRLWRKKGFAAAVGECTKTVARMESDRGEHDAGKDEESNQIDTWEKLI